MPEWAPLTLATCRPVPPRERWGWRSLFLAAGCRVTFEASTAGHDVISVGRRRILLPPSTISLDPSLVESRYWEIAGRRRWLAVPEDAELRVETFPDGVRLTADPFRACVAGLTLQHESATLPRGGDGTLSAFSVKRWRDAPESMLFDCVLETASLICELLDLAPPHLLGRVLGEAPYGLVVSFDLEGFKPGQVDFFLSLMQRWKIDHPTVFSLAHAGTESSIYDPIIDLCDPEMVRLYDSTVEIGLHSSFRTACRPDLLAAQKSRLEEASGRKIVGHRSYYLRFFVPQTWGYLIRSGITYDASLGFSDLAGNRCGANVPVLISDPGGDGNSLWSVAMGLMDKQLLFPDLRTNLKWENGIPHGLEDLFEHLKATRGLLTLDWRIRGLDTAQFPHHLPALTYLIQKAKSDGAWIGGLGQVVQGVASTALAQAIMSDQDIPVREKPIDLATATDHKHYHAVSDAAATKVATYVDSSTASLLSVLPADAEIIVDAGCGHGWVSNELPPFHQVLCTDISEQAMSLVTRRKALGSITDLPLPDGSADLVIATDVVEHLTDQELALASDELKRVSRRYVYLQCPHDEDLRLSEAVCARCGVRWHAVRHVRSVSAKLLSQQLGPTWLPKILVMTGDVSYRCLPSSAELGLGADTPIFSYAREVICPSCGTTNRYRDDELISERLNRSWRVSQQNVLASPTFSEIGVLLEKDGTLQPDDGPHVLTPSARRKPVVPATPVFGNVVRFRSAIQQVFDVDLHSMLPQVALRNCALLSDADGAEIVGSRLAETKSISVYFYDTRRATTATIFGSVRGASVGSAIQVNVIDAKLREQAWQTIAPITGPFELQIDLAGIAPVGIAIHCPAALEVHLREVSLDDQGPMLWLYDFGERFQHSHVVMTHNGIQIRWIIPPTGYLITPLPIEATMKEMIEEVRSGSCAQAHAPEDA